MKRLAACKRDSLDSAGGQDLVGERSCIAKLPCLERPGILIPAPWAPDGTALYPNNKSLPGTIRGASRYCAGKIQQHQ
jgi:hypothetical protein